MRTTISLEPDVWAAVERLRRDRSLGLSTAVNELIRTGLTAGSRRHTFTQRTSEMGARMDVANIGDLLETLDGPAGR